MHAKVDLQYFTWISYVLSVRNQSKIIRHWTYPHGLSGSCSTNPLVTGEEAQAQKGQVTSPRFQQLLAGVGPTRKLLLHCAFPQRLDLIGRISWKICFETLKSWKCLKVRAECYPHGREGNSRKTLRGTNQRETRPLWNHSALSWGRPTTEAWALTHAPSFILIAHKLSLTIFLLLPGAPKDTVRDGLLALPSLLSLIPALSLFLFRM